LLDRLFVYGTLRLGSTNEYAELLARQAQYVGRAKIAGRLYRVAHYPGLAPPESIADLVKGDVFAAVSAQLFEQMDEYEGPEYSRQITEVKMENGRTLTAYCYRYILPTAQLERIQSGDWMRGAE